MKLTKEEARWLDDKWNDFYYYFDVESMYQKDWLKCFIEIWNAVDTLWFERMNQEVK